MKIIKTIPNLISTTRIIMTFLFVHAILEQFKYGQDRNTILVVLFLAICASDLIDGRIARKMNSVSTVGAKLDVFADLLYIIISYLVLADIEILPLWFLIYICFKFIEFIITSKIIKNYNESLENPFVFDKIGRIVSATFLIIPGIVCIYKFIEPNDIRFVVNCMLCTIFIAGMYSSYLRIRNCFVVASFSKSKFGK